MTSQPANTISIGDTIAHLDEWWNVTATYDMPRSESVVLSLKRDRPFGAGYACMELKAGDAVVCR